MLKRYHRNIYNFLQLFNNMPYTNCFAFRTVCTINPQKYNILDNYFIFGLYVETWELNKTHEHLLDLTKQRAESSLESTEVINLFQLAAV